MKRIQLFASFLHLAAILTFTTHPTQAQRIITFDHAQTITTFDIDVPGGIDTTPTAMTPSGDVVGTFLSEFSPPYPVYRVSGFLRKVDGTYTEIDSPSAISEGDTYPTAVNSSGQVAGFVLADLYLIYYGFVRDANGKITEIACCYSLNTRAVDVNPQGEVVGNANDILGGPEVSRAVGFLWEPDGTLTTIDIGGFGNTSVVAINSAGQITGSYYTGQEVRGFLRDANGDLTTFGVLNATSTVPVAISDKGRIAGYYIDSESAVHGFLRDADGDVRRFDVPGARTFLPVAINSRGQIAGYYSGADGREHGFLRKANGDFTTFDVPNAKDTVPKAIGSRGEIAGWYTDSNGKYHGFIWSQRKHESDQE